MPAPPPRITATAVLGSLFSISKSLSCRLYHHQFSAPNIKIIKKLCAVVRSLKRRLKWYISGRKLIADSEIPLEIFTSV